jgi:hypothetical protein
MEATTMVVDLLMARRAKMAVLGEIGQTREQILSTLETVDCLVLLSLEATTQ